MRTLLCLLALLSTAFGACTSRGQAPATRAASSGGTAGYAGGVDFVGRNLPLEQVTARSRATGRPAMLYLVTSWCGYCRKLERETLPDPQVGRHVAGYINVGYDCDAGVGRQVADRYGVRGFPTLLRIDASGNVTGRYEGFDPPASFVQRIPAR
jgi:protein disulfide-isomerase